MPARSARAGLARSEQTRHADAIRAQDRTQSARGRAEHALCLGPARRAKPAGLDVGPAIPLAERALESGKADELLRLLRDTITTEVNERLARVKHLERTATGGVAQSREHIEAMLGFEVWSNKVYQALVGAAHAGEEHHAT